MTRVPVWQSFCDGARQPCADWRFAGVLRGSRSHQDHVLIALRPPQTEGDSEPGPDDMAIVVHPNFVID